MEIKIVFQYYFPYFAVCFKFQASCHACLCVCVASLRLSHQFISHVGTGLPGLNQNVAEDKLECLAQGLMHHMETASIVVNLLNILNI